MELLSHWLPVSFARCHLCMCDNYYLNEITFCHRVSNIFSSRSLRSFDLCHQNSNSLLHLIRTTHKYQHNPFTHCLVLSMTMLPPRLLTCRSSTSFGLSTFFGLCCFFFVDHSCLHLLNYSTLTIIELSHTQLLDCWIPCNKLPQRFPSVSSSVCVTHL